MIRRAGAALALVASMNAGASECNTPDEKADAILDYLIEHYMEREWIFSMISPSETNESGNSFEIDFYPDTNRCTGELVINESCEIEGVLSCKPYEESGG